MSSVSPLVKHTHAVIGEMWNVITLVEKDLIAVPDAETLQQKSTNIKVLLSCAKQMEPLPVCVHMRPFTPKPQVVDASVLERKVLQLQNLVAAKAWEIKSRLKELEDTLSSMSQARLVQLSQLLAHLKQKLTPLTPKFGARPARLRDTSEMPRVSRRSMASPPSDLPASPSIVRKAASAIIISSSSSSSPSPTRSQIGRASPAPVVKVTKPVPTSNQPLPYGATNQPSPTLSNRGSPAPSPITKRYASPSVSPVKSASPPVPAAQPRPRSAAMDSVIPLEELDFDREIGTGSYGKVYRGLYKSRIVAIKTIKLLSEQHKAFLKREILILSRIQHDNILDFVGIAKERDIIYVITELVSNGELTRVLNDGVIPIHNWLTRIKIGLESCRALAYLHDMRIFHGDIKTENMLLHGEWVTKLCDFGFARIVRDRLRDENMCGSAYFAAPEVIKCQWYSFPADVFAWGVFMMELISVGKVTFMRGQHSNYLFDFQKLRSEFHLLGCSGPFFKPLCDLAFSCCSGSPTKRPTMRQVATAMEALWSDVQLDSSQSLPRIPEQYSVDYSSKQKKRIAAKAQHEAKRAERSARRRKGSRVKSSEPVATQATPGKARARSHTASSTASKATVGSRSGSPVDGFLLVPKKETASSTPGPAGAPRWQGGSSGGSWLSKRRVFPSNRPASVDGMSPSVGEAAAMAEAVAQGEVRTSAGMDSSSGGALGTKKEPRRAGGAKKHRTVAIGVTEIKAELAAEKAAADRSRRLLERNMDQDSLDKYANPRNSKSSTETVSTRALFKKKPVRLEATMANRHVHPAQVIVIEITMVNQAKGRRMEGLEVVLRDPSFRVIDTLTPVDAHLSTHPEERGSGSVSEHVFPVLTDEEKRCILTYRIPTQVKRSDSTADLFDLCLTVPIKGKGLMSRKHRLSLHLPFHIVQPQLLFETNPHQVFATPLELVCLREESECPRVLDDAMRYFSTTFHTYVGTLGEGESLFSLGGNPREVLWLRYLYDTGKRPRLAALEDANSMAMVLKEFLRSLPDPLCTYKLYDAFLEVSADLPLKERVHQYRALINTLGPVRVGIIRRFLLFLADMVELSAPYASHAISAQRLASMFGSVLLRPPESAEREAMTTSSDVSLSSSLSSRGIGNMACVTQIALDLIAHARER